MKLYIIKDNLHKDFYDIFIKKLDKNTLPIIDFDNKTIKNNILFYNKILSKKYSFEENLYRIKNIFGAFVTDNKYNIDINKINYIPCDITYKIKIKPKLKFSDELINHAHYTPNNRKLFEYALQTFKPINICFYNGLTYSKFIIGACQTLNKYKYKLNIHSFGQFYYPLFNPNLIEKNPVVNLHNDNYDELNYKYLRLNYSINNLIPYSNNNITLYGSLSIINTIIYLISNNIKIDFFVIEYIESVIILQHVITKLYYINPNIIIYINTNEYEIKKYITDELNPFSIFDMNSTEKSLSPYSNLTLSYIITNIKYPIKSFNKNILPISNFYNYKFITINDPHKYYYVSKYNFDLDPNYKSIDKLNNITKNWIISTFSYIYDKYKKELDLLNKFINNDYIYIIHYTRIIFINNLCFYLNSNINQYECIFLNNIIENYIKMNPKKDNKYNIFEIGCAYGTSGMIISNIFTKNKNKNNELNLWSIDPNQQTQWHNIGSYNINKIINENKNANIKWNLIEKYSHESILYLQKLKITFDICFIDGAHDFVNVYGDIVLTDSILNIGGVIILDDVRHDGVKDAVLYFFKNNNKYKRIFFNDNLGLEYTKSLYNTTYNKNNKSYTNPDTMYAFIKLY